eukprot:gene1857-2193_t
MQQRFLSSSAEVSPPPPNPPYPPIPQNFQGFQFWCNPRTQYAGSSLFCYFGFYLGGMPRSNTFCCAKVEVTSPRGPNENVTGCGVQNPTVSITLNSPRAGTDLLTAVCCDQSTAGVNDFDTCISSSVIAAGGPRLGSGSVAINWLAAPPPPPRPPKRPPPPSPPSPPDTRQTFPEGIYMDCSPDPAFVGETETCKGGFSLNGYLQQDVICCFRSQVARGGYALPGGPTDVAIRCVGDTYAPDLNRLRRCLKCQSGLGPPEGVNLGLQADRNEVCQVPPGRFWELNIVRLCPKGLYRERFVKVTDKAAINCLPCPLGWTTPGLNLESATAGVEPDSGDLPSPGDDPPDAEPCPRNFYYDGTPGVYACTACPYGSITQGISASTVDECGDGTPQDSILNCKVVPGCGVVDGNTTNPPGGVPPTVCAAGFGIPSPTSTNVADCAECSCGFYSEGDGTSCTACPETRFNHPVGNTYISQGITFWTKTPNSLTCVPEHAQLPAPCGAMFSVHDSVFTIQGPAAAASPGACVDASPKDKCTIVQFEEGPTPSTNVCKHAVLPPVGPVAENPAIPRLYYKLPPSELISDASIRSSNQVRTKTKSSGIYARCNMAAWGTLPEDGEIGTSPNPYLVEQQKQTVEWNTPAGSKWPCYSEASCQRTCDALATCWGYIYVQSKGFAIRGGEDQLDVRSFFSSPNLCSQGPPPNPDPIDPVLPSPPPPPPATVASSPPPLASTARPALGARL